MGKKTIEVADILERTNHILGLAHIGQEEKKALVFMLESVLHATENYEGYMNLALPLVKDVPCDYDRKYYVNASIRDSYNSYADKRKANGGDR